MARWDHFQARMSTLPALRLRVAAVQTLPDDWEPPGDNPMSDKLDVSGASQAEVEAAVRRYIAKVARRYSPLLIGLAVLLLVVILVPSVTPEKATNVSTGVGQDLGSAGGSGGTTETTVAGGSAAGASGGAGAGATGGQRALAVPKGITAPAAAGSAGVTRSGVQ
jgi:hypothetical protein